MITCTFKDSSNEPCKQKPVLKADKRARLCYYHNKVQRKLLESGINLLKSGGILLYSTCSLYAEEGELQLMNFLDRLEPLELPNLISPSYEINHKKIKGTGRLFPSIHHTKGFFIGLFKKK